MEENNQEEILDETGEARKDGGPLNTQEAEQTQPEGAGTAETSGTQEESEASGAQGEPEAPETREEPETSGTQGEPGTPETQGEPETSGAQEESETSGGREEPETAGSQRNPEASGENGRQKPPDDGTAEDAPQKRGFFSKKKKDKRDTQIEELTDRVHRQMAEFDNFRKRSEKEKAAMFEIGARSMLEKILPTVDNFERGLAGLTEEQKADPFAQGMEKVYRQMMTALEDAGVKPIEAVGKPFDPNLHNAVMHVEDEEAGENIVVEEFQKGYLYHDTVVRHSMVKVAN